MARITIPKFPKVKKLWHIYKQYARYECIIIDGIDPLKAKEVCRKEGQASFNGSIGWFKRFEKSCGIKLAKLHGEDISVFFQLGCYNKPSGAKSDDGHHGVILS